MKKEWTIYSHAADVAGFTQYEAQVGPSRILFLEPTESEAVANCSVFVSHDQQSVVINPPQGIIFTAMAAHAAKEFPHARIIPME